MARYADILTAVKEAVGDATDDQAKRWITHAARLLNAEARWLTYSVTIGTTTADTDTYTLPNSDFVDLEAVLVDGEVYEPASPSQYDQLKAGHTKIGARLYSSYWSDAGAPQIRLWPVPDESGLSITGRQVVTLPTIDWTTGDPPFPVDFDLALERMAIALGKARLDEELQDAVYFEERFAGDIGRLKARKRHRGSKGPVQIQVKGYHW